MSYTVLARKWRPRTFAEMAGQDHVLRALINALDNDRLHHGFLFTGTRGVGKTTIARIFAKCINCEAGITSTPCTECSACQEIDDGRFVDLIEVDAASRTKVDDTRELLDNVQYAPSVGRFKVYLIDEVHMLSRHSFNALLKTLEEPPPHVKFLLATTDPQKLPATVLSRCLQFNLKRLPKDIIVSRLEEICTAEKFDFEQSAFELLAHGADGSMRDALSLLDQAVAYGGGKVEEQEVRAMLGTVERGKVFELARTVASKDAAKVLEQVAAMDEFAPDYGEVLQELSLLLQRSAIFAMTKVAPRDSAEMASVVTDLCAALTPDQIQLFYQIAIIGRRDLPLAPDTRSGFEMVMLRMLAFMPDALGSTGNSGATGSGDKTSSVTEETAKTAAQAVPASEAGAKKKLASKPAAPVQESAQTPSSAAQHQPTKEPTTTRTSSSATVSAGGVDFSNWASVIELMGLQGAARQLAANCVVTGCSQTHVDLLLDGSNQHMLTKQVEQKLSAVIQNHLGDDFVTNVRLGEVSEDTPAILQQQQEAAERRSVRETLINDPNVKALLDTFDATIHEDTIKPIN